MSKYIKIRSGEEYRVSDNGLYIERRYIPSQKKWTTAYPIPDCKKVLDLRETKTGARIEVLLNDNRWYEDNGQGFLIFTQEERAKDRKGTRKKSEKSVDADRQSKTKMHKSGSSVGKFLHDAKSAVDDFRKVDDFLNFESDANHIANEFISGQMNMMADSWRSAEEDRQRMDRKLAARENEINELRKLERRYMARDEKKNFFVAMEALLGNDAFDYLSAKDLIKFLKITTPDTQRVMAQALEACKQSLHEVGQTPKAIKYWSEVFYLINEGILFRNVDYIVKLMSKEFGGSNTIGLEDDDCIEGFLEYIYPKVPHEVYWGQNFDKEPDEDRKMARLEYLQTNLFFDDDESEEELIGRQVSSDDYEYEEDEDDEDDGEEDEEENGEEEDEEDGEEEDEEDGEEEDEDEEDEEEDREQHERTSGEKEKSHETESALSLVLKFFTFPFVFAAKFYKFMFKDILKF